jgi:hypothetical protein
VAAIPQLLQVEADASGLARLRRSRRQAWRDGARWSEGCYELRSNVTDWSAEDLWRVDIQVTSTEAAFCVPKSELAVRRVWQK